MNYGLCTISNKDWPVEDVLELAAEAGYDGVEVWGKDHVGNTDGPGSPNLESCRAIANRATELNLEVPVYGSYLRAGTDGFRDALDAELDAAASLGADLVRVWPGNQEYGNHDATHWNAVIEDLERAGRQAADHSLAITVEKHEGTVTNQSEGARQLIKTVDSPAVGLNWQPLFFMNSEHILAEAETLAPLSNNIHLQAMSTRDGSTRCQLSEAYFDIGAVLDVFDNAGFEGYAEVEFVNPEMVYEAAVLDDINYLTDIGS